MAMELIEEIKQIMEGTTGYPYGRKMNWVLDLNENVKH